MWMSKFQLPGLTPFLTLEVFICSSSVISPASDGAVSNQMRQSAPRGGISRFSAVGWNASQIRADQREPERTFGVSRESVSTATVQISASRPCAGVTVATKKTRGDQVWLFSAGLSAVPHASCCHWLPRAGPTSVSPPDSFFLSFLLSFLSSDTVPSIIFLGLLLIVEFLPASRCRFPRSSSLRHLIGCCQFPSDAKVIQRN